MTLGYRTPLYAVKMPVHLHTVSSLGLALRSLDARLDTTSTWSRMALDQVNLSKKRLYMHPPSVLALSKSCPTASILSKGPTPSLQRQWTLLPRRRSLKKDSALRLFARTRFTKRHLTQLQSQDGNELGLSWPAAQDYSLMDISMAYAHSITHTSET